MNTELAPGVGLSDEQLQVLREHAERSEDTSPEDDQERVRSMIEESTPYREWLDSELQEWEAGKRPRGTFEPTWRREQLAALSVVLSQSVSEMRGLSTQQACEWCFPDAVEGQIELVGLFRLRGLAESEMQRAKDAGLGDVDPERADELIDQYADLQTDIESLQEELELGFPSEEDMEIAANNGAPDGVDPQKHPKAKDRPKSERSRIYHWFWD